MVKESMNLFFQWYTTLQCIKHTLLEKMHSNNNNAKRSFISGQPNRTSLARLLITSHYVAHLLHVFRIPSDIVRQLYHIGEHHSEDVKLMFSKRSEHCECSDVLWGRLKARRTRLRKGSKPTLPTNTRANCYVHRWRMLNNSNVHIRIPRRFHHLYHETDGVILHVRLHHALFLIAAWPLHSESHSFSGCRDAHMHDRPLSPVAYPLETPFLKFL